MKRVIVVGATGFIGRHLCAYLANVGVEVIAATRLPASFEKVGHVRNVVSDFIDAKSFSPFLSECDAVIHVASSTTPGSNAASPQIDGNLRTTLALLEALQNASQIRLVFFSSAGALYGHRVSPARESDLLRPRSYHGAGKAAAEHFIHAWAEQYAGTAVILRPTNVYGPGQSARLGFGVIPTAFDCALNGKPLTIWDGSTVRDYLYIDDLVELCAATLTYPFRKGAQVFNAAFGEGVALDTLINRIDAVTHLPIERHYEPARRVDIHSITADTTAARSTFGWSPAIALDEGLNRTWQWYSTQA